MSKFKDIFQAKALPDSNYYLDQDNVPQEDQISEYQKSNKSEIFEWPNTYWSLPKEQMGGLQ